MREVEGEVDDATASRSQVGLIEEHTHQETLHYSGHSECEEKQEQDDWITVIQHFAYLRTKTHKNEDTHLFTV